VQIILHTVDEVVPKQNWGRIFTLGSTYLLKVDWLLVNGNEISVFLDEKTWDFSSSKHRVDCFQESLELNFSVGKDESDRLTSGSCEQILSLDVFLKVVVVIGLVKSYLEERLLADKRRQLSKGLFA
jgi:hypothetical protein